MASEGAPEDGSTAVSRSADSSAASGPHRFRPLYGDAPGSPPLAWYCPLPAPRAEDEERDLVRGPFITRDLRQLGIPAPSGSPSCTHRPTGRSPSSTPPSRTANARLG
ncbi:hypothetical protein SALBM311S_04590 [Streptomyces alboniger]